MISLKEIAKTVKNKRKELRREFIDMLLGSLGASLLGIILPGRKVKNKIPRKGVVTAE